MPEVTATKSETTQTEPQAKPLKSTLNLPQTAFAMKANLPVNEPIRLAAWQQQDIYAQIRSARAGAPKYILHDGPPYANGAIHLGHALNKCIKDFVVKTKTMAGFDAPYVPGWDCHGLPIEIKVDEQLGRKKLEMDPLAVRKACREYAQKYVDLQRSQFERIGVFGRWSNPYLTMSLPYEASIVETFYNFFEKGFVYKGLKPVYWCIHDRTALAEAEIEYEMHTSPSIYVRYALTSEAAAIDPALANLPVYTIIWTTTPWTLPASLAVAFNPELDYVALKNTDGNIYIVAEALAAQTRDACNLPDAKEIARFKGTQLDRVTFQHPFLQENGKAREILGVNADYVTTDQGTGAVHTAPSHGADDFATGTRYGLSQLCDVDAAGRLRNGLPEYDGLQIFKANPAIIELVRARGALMGLSEIHHSYPHCWRCHNPVIFRATEQWFISMETPMPAQTSNAVTLSGAKNPGSSPEVPQPPATTTETFRQRTLDEIANVIWDPSWGQERISNMIATRPDWTISRQRIWGVPIAVFMCEKCHTPLNDPTINKSIVDLFHREGADAWYAHDVAALLPAGTACASCAGTAFRKEMDILDVWFESGASWHAVLDVEPELEWPADLYTEGGDQHRGWFHSSILTSVAVRGKAPYRMVATSGWTLDEQGRAFSKSLGNGVDPVDIAKRLGGEIVRLWVASVDFREDVAASENLMQRVSDNYRKLRNTFRFLLGNLHDFNPATDAVHNFAKLEPLDQYIFARLAELDKKIRRAYDDFEFHRAYHALNEFINTDLSALYLDVLKDRLYTFAPNAPARRSAQTALWRIAETLTRLVAPILSFTAEEVWHSLPKIENREASVHLALFPSLSEVIPVDTKNLLEDWQKLLDVRSEALVSIEAERKAGRVGKGLDASVDLLISDAALSQLLARYSTALPELFNVSHVTLKGAVASSNPQSVPVAAITVPASGTKCERCWRYTTDVGDEAKYPTVCLRCADALDAIGYPPYAASSPTE
ncbi:isoleucine--tRNA ligase [Edaphobacter modestus]|uniref:Isoleucine--tRNA ligase n=1 Tax=Edaphobacter modestus TaxID=388466 RepID=A0A4V6MFX1_9BACT|nr:isoleucine--tRNA ligase [Edaphobacter modestus]RZU43546.1 isoleucyl-tRNA synthetase [Edaphobacter modestus]